MSVDRTLSGAGVGPGDPDHVAAKALWTLEAADIILVPSTEVRVGSIGYAEKIVCAHLPTKIGAAHRIPFSMTERRGTGQRRADAWEASVTIAVEALEAGAKWVAFATVGDAPVFLTSSRLCDPVSRRVEIKVEVIPGITAMQAIAAASRTPLVEGQEIPPLVSWTAGPETLAHVCEVPDTVVIYKGGREIAEFRVVLDAQSRLGETVFGINLGSPSEHLASLSEVTDRVPYFSIVFAASKRPTTGGRIRAD